MSHSITHAATLLVENLALIETFSTPVSVLDLACGAGRNGLYLAGHNIPVTFVDNNQNCLDRIEQTLAADGLRGDTRLVDLESTTSKPLAGYQANVCLVFNYLHRPLFPAIKQCLLPGGLIFYETFTVLNRQFGRPNNPDYLLHEKELMSYFEGWDILHYAEGEFNQPVRATAQLLARKK
jgi:SAM-dependent methyltransferase